MKYKGMEEKLRGIYASYGLDFEEAERERSRRETGRHLVGMLLNHARKSKDMGLIDNAKSWMRDAQDFATDYGIDIRKMLEGNRSLTRILSNISSNVSMQTSS